jgi:hypothetical protein
MVGPNFIPQIFFLIFNLLIVSSVLLSTGAINHGAQWFRVVHMKKEAEPFFGRLWCVKV